MPVRRELVVVIIVASVIFISAYMELPPVRSILDWRASLNATAEHATGFDDYEVYDHTHGDDAWLTVDFVKGKHFWNPQIAIWIEDSTGRHIETLLVTTSTARGLFYAGRTPSNFKQSDRAKEVESSPTRRVDALPYWSHKRGHKYADGYYSPPPEQALPDGITGATPSGNFYLQTVNNFKDLDALRILVEINVAFDDNEYFSEYDFLEDSLYHGGTGLLGQPSIVYGCTITRSDSNNYYVLHALGHGHHSGATGELFADVSKLTTARKIVERIVVGINDDWYHK